MKSKVKKSVVDLYNITTEEYLEAEEICERFKYQQDKTIRVSVDYEATLSVDIKVPDDMSVEEIKEELKNGYSDFDVDIDSKEDIKLGKMKSLIVNGKQLKL